MGSPLPQPQPPQRRYTVDEYLAMERAAELRHVYLDGTIVPMAGDGGPVNDSTGMAGESPEHADITTNLVLTVAGQLKGKPCRARSKDTKVRSGRTLMSGTSIRGMFSYPDLVVVCGEPEYPDAHRDIILNPTAILEVLSASTEAFDRGEKFTRYRRWNPTLTDYLLVSQDRPQIEHFIRQPSGRWAFDTYEGLDAEVPIPSIGCTLKLADVYDRVTFPEEPETNDDAP